MNDFKRGGQNFGGGRDRNRGFGGGGRSGGRPDMHKAVCSDCGKDCEVPFRPSGDKPVFCSDCFKKQGGGAPRGGESRNFGDRNARPSFGNKPSYQNGPSANSDNYKAQFAELNSKLDQILKAVTTVTHNISEEKKEAKAIVPFKPNISKEIKEIKALVKKASPAKPAAKKPAKKAVKKANGKKKK